GRFRFGDYFRAVGQRFLGYGDALAAAGQGLWHSATTPTWELAHEQIQLLMNLPTAIDAMRASIDQKMQTERGQSELVGPARIFAATILPPSPGPARAGSAAAIEGGVTDAEATSLSAARAGSTAEELAAGARATAAAQEGITEAEAIELSCKWK